MGARSDASINRRNPGAYFGVPLPVWVIAFLAAGLLVGLRFTSNRVTAAIYVSGTYFPKAVVSFATLIVFTLLAGATAKLVLVHRRGAGRLFGFILATYVGLACASLVYVTIWIPFLTKLPLARSGSPAPGIRQWLWQLAQSLSTLFSEQPLTQMLVFGVVIGYVCAGFPLLRPLARGLIAGADATLWLFNKLLWYYPLMIGCLAIGIPLRFGVKGMAAYGQTTLWVALVTVSWSLILVTIVKLTTKRSLRQLISYYAAVWPTGFGTGGSYETLAMNVVSAESDLGLPREIAEVSIVFGTVMNKSCAGISMMLVTIAVTRLLGIPMSLVELLTLVPPLLILTLESPGIPGGAAFFMSPVVAALLHVRDVNGFVATFVTVYSGLIPMFSTAGNTTNDGLMGALLTDRFSKYIKLREADGTDVAREAVDAKDAVRHLAGGKTAGAILAAVGSWMLISPQALLGLGALRWMHRYSFPGEAVAGAVITTIALYLLAPAARRHREMLVRSQAITEDRPAAQGGTTEPG